MLLTRVLGWFTWLRILWVDGGYTGETFAQWVKGLRPKLAVQVVKRSADTKGFKGLPRRWVAVLQGQAASALGDAFQIFSQALTQPAFGAGSFLCLGGHPHQGQRVPVPGHETIQRTEDGQGIGAVGLDAFALVVPVARANDVIGHAQRGQLAMQTVAKRIGLVTENDFPACRDLFFSPTPENPGA